MPDHEKPAIGVRSPNRILSERIQFVSCAILTLFVLGWVGWFYPYDDLLDQSGTPLGADFSMFYVAGQVVADGAGDRLYDQAEHQSRLQQLFPDIDPSFALPYRYPPFVAAIAAPLAKLPYAVAYSVFFVCSCGAWWFATRQLIRCVPELKANWGKSLRWALLGWPVALETLIGGQASMYALLIAVSVYALIRHQRLVLAGMVLALAAYKPNVLALLALACLIRYPRMIVGFAPVAIGIGSLCLIPDGWRGILAYRELTTMLATESWDVATPLWKVHGLAPWFNLLVGVEGRMACGVLGGVTAIGLAVHARFVCSTEASGGFKCPLAQPCAAGASGRGKGEGRYSPIRHSPKNIEPLWFATLLSVNALFNAYTPIYDLVLLSIGAVLTAEHLASRFGPNVNRSLIAAQLLIAIVYFGPHLSQVVAKSTSAQPFGLVLAAVALWQGCLLWQSQRTATTLHEPLLPSAST